MQLFIHALIQVVSERAPQAACDIDFAILQQMSTQSTDFFNLST